MVVLARNGNCCLKILQVDSIKSFIVTLFSAVSGRTFDNPHSQNQSDVVGKYECHLYDKGGKNNWHYVTVSKGAGNTLIWKNRAGVQWTLEATPDKSVLDVHSDCPYFNFVDGTRRTNYHQATVVRSGNKVTAIIGPWGESYDRSDASAIGVAG